MRTLLNRLIAAALLLIFSFLLLPRPCYADVFLTGLLQDGTASNGQTAGSPIWNTLGNELSFANLYITQPNGGYAAPFINSGNGAGTSISYALTPGTYQFYFFCDPLAENNPGYYGLNLFFDGNNNTSPGISAFSPAATSAANAVPAGFGTLVLSVNTNSPNPPPGSYIYTATPVSAPGTLTYTADGLSVTLTAYGFGLPGVFGGPGLDRVGNLNDAPDGQLDGVGFFDLTVVSVPEPSAMALCSAAAAIFITWKRRQASQCKRSVSR
jgi:hypothetical protein